MRHPSTDKQSTAAILMFLSVVGYSIVPLIIDYAAPENNPFLLNAVIRLALVATTLVYLARTNLELLRNKDLRRLLKNRSKGWIFFLAALGPLDYGFFLWAAQIVDTTIVVIIYELWSLPFIFLMDRLLRERNATEPKHQPVNRETIILLIFAVAGFIFVTLGPTGGSLGTVGPTGIAVEWGILVAVAAAGFASFAAFSFRWSRDARRDLSDPGEADTLQLALNLICFVIISIPALIANLLLSIPGVSDGVLITRRGALLGLVIGMLAGISGILFRMSNTLSTDPAVNAMFYLKPVLALIALTLVTSVDIARGDLVAIGAAAILATNLLINFDPEKRYGPHSRVGFKALILGTWFFGTIVYFRDEIFGNIILVDFVWKGGEYWSALGLSATIFTLILAFRITRLVERTSREEERVVQLFRHLELMVTRRVLSPSILDDVLTIDSITVRHRPTGISMSSGAPSDPLELAYLSAMRQLETAASIKNTRGKQDIVHQQELIELAAEIDALVHSKQYGRDFGETIAIVIFSLITVSLAVLVRPGTADSMWTGFLVEMFSTVFAATISFLVFNLVDMSRDRGGDVLIKTGLSSGYRVMFRSPSNLRRERLIAVIVGTSVAVVFGFLFWEKWQAIGW